MNYELRRTAYTGYESVDMKAKYWAFYVNDYGSVIERTRSKPDGARVFATLEKAERALLRELKSRAREYARRVKNFKSRAKV